MSSAALTPAQNRRLEESAAPALAKFHEFTWKFAPRWAAENERDFLRQWIDAMNRLRILLPLTLGAAGQVIPSSAHASFLPPEMMDSAAMGLAWFIIVFVPIGAIVLFWMVHVLPEKIAHKRHHPQRDAIHVLCLLSLVFGGLLWPIAWLWAYTKPTAYRLAYGTEKHEDYFREMAAKAHAGELPEHELAHLREELDAIAAKGGLSAELKVLRRDLQSAQAKPAGPDTVSTVPSIAGAKAGAA